MPEAWSESPVKGKIASEDLPDFLDVGEDRGNGDGCLDWLFVLVTLILTAAALGLLDGPMGG